MAQTRILYNEQQLHQLIHQHLLSKGFTESAAYLQREANLDSPNVAKTLTYHQPFHYRSPVTTTVSFSNRFHFIIISILNNEFYNYDELIQQPRPAFSPGTAANLYNIRCAQRDAAIRNNTTPTNNSRFISHTSSTVANSTPVTNPIRIKLADTLNQSPVVNSQPIKLQISQK